MSTNGVLSVKYVTLSVALMLVCLWDTQLRENYLRALNAAGQFSNSRNRSRTEGPGLDTPFLLVISLLTYLLTYSMEQGPS